MKKTILVALALTLPFTAVAQQADMSADVQADALTDAQKLRDAELDCQWTGLCGDDALAESQREKEMLSGVQSRSPLTVGLQARSKRAVTSAIVGSSAVETGTAPVEAVPVVPATVDSNVQRVVTQQVEPSMRPGTAVLNIGFALDSDRFTEDSKFDISSAARVMKRIEARGEGQTFTINGHTDASGSDDYNLDLSRRRAAAVYDALIRAGVDASRLEYVGYGESAPIDASNPMDSSNRRVEVVANG